MVVFALLSIVAFATLWNHHLSGADSFVHTPGTIQVCDADDLVLPWSLSNESLPSIREINWYHTEGRDTPLGRWTETSGAVFFEPYKNRAKQLIGSNAGIVIVNVTSADRGQYVIDTGITPDSVSDTAEVHVYPDSCLVPTLIASGDFIAFNTTLYYEHGTSVVFNVITTSKMQADISISTEGSEVVMCQSKDICKGVVNVIKQEVIVRFTLDYHVCQPFEEVVYLKTTKGVVNEESIHTNVVVCVMLVVVIPLVAIIILIIVWFVLRNKQRKGTRLSKCQSRYVQCALLYQLTRCSDWGPEDVKTDRHPEVTVTTPLSYGYYCKGDNVEIPGTAVQNVSPTEIRNKNFLDKAKYEITSIPSRILDFFQPGDTAAAELESRDDNEKTNIPNQKDTETTEDTSQIPGARKELPSKSTKDVTDPDQVAAPMGHVSITKDKKKQRKEEARRLAAEKKEQDNKSGNDVDQGSTSGGDSPGSGKEFSRIDRGTTEGRVDDWKKGSEKSSHETIKEPLAKTTLEHYGAAGGIV